MNETCFRPARGARIETADSLLANGDTIPFAPLAGRGLKHPNRLLVSCTLMLSPRSRGAD